MLVLYVNSKIIIFFFLQALHAYFIRTSNTGGEMFGLLKVMIPSSIVTHWGDNALLK